MRNWKATMTVLLIMAIIVIGYRGTVHNNKQNEYFYPELKFQDHITTKALDYARHYRPDWRWTIATFCTWPNQTVTVLVYGNYTTSCKGYTCSNVDGTLYSVSLNLTNLALISFKKAHSNAYDELISRCKVVWDSIERMGLTYCHRNLGEKGRVLTYCLWPNGTVTFLFQVNYTTVCEGYDCSDVNGTFYEVTFDPTTWKPISSQRVSSNEYHSLQNRCALARIDSWKNQTHQGNH